MIGVLIGLTLPIMAVWWLLQATGLRRPADSPAVMAGLAVCLGIGAASLTTFWFVNAGGTINRTFALADGALWGIAGATSWWRLRADFKAVRREPSPGSVVTPQGSPHRPVLRLVQIAFALTAIIALAAIAAEYRTSPHGQWDAWAIWNQKARFLLRAGELWTASLAISWSNPSHPLLVSASVARLWGYAGAELTMAPALLGLTFGAGIVAIVMGALDMRRPRAWIAGTILIAPGTFVQQVASQMSDLPVALFVVATLVALQGAIEAARRNDGDAPRWLLLCGLLAGLAAWTKNEGLVLLAVVAPIVLWHLLRFGRPRDAAWWVAGAVPGLAVAAWLKLVVARVPPEYFSQAGSSATLLERAFDLARHDLLGGLIAPFWTRWGGPGANGALPLVMGAALVVSCTRGGRAARSTVITTTVMASAYYLVWLLSPLDTTWLIATSFERLMFQLWPSFILAAFSYDNASRA
jgi:hypothetical protein